MTETPIADFVRRYADSGTVRLHMPGHKGRPVLGCENWDITEISGTDGLIEQSEAVAAELFGAGRTVYSAGGSSQCVRAMVYLAVARWRAVQRGTAQRPVIVAARNAHKSFLYGCALCDADVAWLRPSRRTSLWSCPVTAEQLGRTLEGLSREGTVPAAAYVTSPDYLGGVQDIAALAETAHRYGVPLLVDNAHGAYLRFLEPSRHPLDLGADLCCDSAHKTLPVLTGGAHLHIGKSAPAFFREQAGTAMELFGSTSPSWLILSSLDVCNRYLAGGYRERLAETVGAVEDLRGRLGCQGWRVEDSDPLRVTLRGDGAVMADRLRRGGVEWEYADRDGLVLMVTPENAAADLHRAAESLGIWDGPEPVAPDLPEPEGETVLSIREAVFAPRETVPAGEAVGRVCAAPTVSCPPAVPVAVSGERVTAAAVAWMGYYGVDAVDVVRDEFCN